MYCHRRNWFEIRVDFLKYQFDKHWSNFGLVKFYKGKKIVQGQWSTSKWEKNNSRSIDMWTSSLEILTWFYGDLSFLKPYSMTNIHLDIMSCIIETNLTRTTTYLRL